MTDNRWAMREKLDLSLSALTSALDRARLSAPTERFAPLAEALLWAVILNDVFYAANKKDYLRARTDLGADRLIEGLRYARHRLVHDIDVRGMHVTVIASKGATTPEGSEDVLWVWGPLKQLPTARDRRGEPFYKELVGKDVAETLTDAEDFLVQYFFDGVLLSG